MATIAPLRIERDGLWAVVHGGHQYRAALQSVGAKWRADNSWRFALTVANLNALVRAGVPIQMDDPALKIMSEQPWLVPARDVPCVDHPHWPKLYPYQQRAVDFLCRSPYPGALLALSCGLGKTPTAIVAAEILDAKSILVLCPKVLIPVWRQEREQWTTLPWNDPKQSVLRPFVITNWEWALHHPAEFTDPRWDLVIIDESILVKQRKTKRFALAKTLRKRADRMWLLSGSPISRFVDDLWTQMYLCFPDAFGSFWRFVDQWCYVQDNPWGGKDIIGSRNYDFPQEFKDLQFTKNQAEVLPDLPDFVEQSIPVELEGEQKTLYRRAQDDLIVQLEGEEALLTNRISQITRLQQLASHPVNLDSNYRGPAVKLDALMDLIESGAVAKPILIWTYFRGTAQAIAATLTKAGHRTAVVIGETPNADALLADYKAGAVDILILGLSVGKYGLSVQNTRTVIYVDRTFDADSFVQSMARVRRLGLDHTFHVVSLFAPHTVDQLIIDNIANKLPAITKVSGGDLAEKLRAL